MTKNLRLLTLADIHGNIKAVKRLVRKVKSSEIQVDMIVIAGDISQTVPLYLMLLYILGNQSLSRRGYSKWVYKGKGRKRFVKEQIISVEAIVSQLLQISDKIIYTPGNTDTKDVIKYLKDNYGSQMHIIDGNFETIGGYQFIGLGGSLIHVDKEGQPICDYEFTRQEFSYRITRLLKGLVDKHIPRILVTHELPSFSYNDINRKVSFQGGSQSISMLITKIKPIMHIFGHYHELAVKKQAQEVLYVNPGPMACYYYALITLNGKKHRVYFRKMKPYILDTNSLIYSYRTPMNDNENKIRFL